MRNLKRALSLVMAMALIVGMMVISASAVSKDFTDAGEIDHTEAVNTMVALGVIDGKDDGSYFDPDGTLTRAEMAKVVAFVMNGGVEPNIGTKVIPTYSDIDNHWAEAYIEYCTSMGIIAGDGAGKFNPGGPLTAEQTAKMFLTAMGYNANVFGLVGANWAMNVGRYANEAGLYDELGDITPSQPISRDDACQMAYNAIQATLMVRGWNQDMQTGEITETYRLDENGANLLGTRFNAVMEYGYIDSVDYNEDRDEYTYGLTRNYFNGGQITVDPVSVGSLTTGLDVSNLFGQRVKVIYETNSARDVYGIYATDSSVLTSAVVGDLPDDLAGESSMKVNDVTYRFDETASRTPVYAIMDDTAILSNVNNLAADLTAGTLYKEWSIDLIDNDGDGRVNLVMVHPFTVAKVSYVGTDTFNTAANTIMSVTADSIDFDDVNAYDGIAKGDYVMIVDGAYTVDGKDTYTKIDTIIEGEIEATRDGELRVDGTWYSYDDAHVPANTYEVGDSFTFVIVNGYVCANDVITTGADLSDYAVVVNAKADTDNGLLGDQAKLLFTDGETKIVDTAYSYAGNYTGSFTADADSALVNALVTYEIEDGKYVLTPAETADAEEAGFDKIAVGSTMSNIGATAAAHAYWYAANGRNTINNGAYYIADDAVIFAQGSDHSFDVISGAALKRYSTASITAVNNAYADQAATGFDNVVLAYVEVAGTVSKSTSDYGYVTTKLTTVHNSDGEDVSELSIWTANGLLENIQADEDLRGNVTRGSIVTFEVNDDGTYTIKDASANVGYGAILAYNSANGDVRVTGASLTAGNADNETYEITGDTVVLFINSNTFAGVEGDNDMIATAVETATDDLYQGNAYYVEVTANNGELALLVVDVYADLDPLPAP